MSDLDIRIKYSFKNNRKRRMLAKLLGPDGIVALIDLWLEVAVQYPTGVLKNCDENDIADMASWGGESLDLVRALESVGFIRFSRKSWRLNDWAEHQAWVINAPARTAKARMAADARWNKEQCPEDASSNATGNAPSPSYPNLSLPYQTEAFEQAWGDFILHRKQIKAKMTPLAIDRALKKLAGYGSEQTAIAIIDQSIENGWKGLFDLKKDNAQKKPEQEIPMYYE